VCIILTIDLLSGGATLIILILLGIFLARLEAGMLMAITPLEREIIAIVISCLLSVVTLPLIMVVVGLV